MVLYKRWCALCCLLACPGLAWSADLLRIGTQKFAHYGAVSYMKVLGPRYGLRIEERVFAKGIDINPALVAGAVDVSASAADAAIAGRAAGVPIVVVAGFAKGGARMVVRQGLKLGSIRDLRGRTVGVARGGAQELLLLAELAQAGLTWSEKPGKDVLIFYMQFADLNAALMAGDIDAMCQSEPQSSQAINQGFGTELLKPYDTPLGEPVRTLVMTEKLLKERPAVARRAMRCFLEATRAFLRHPELAEDYVRRQMFKGQISRQDYQDALANSPFTPDITVEHIQTTTDLMKRYGVGRMASPPRAVDWVRLDLLHQVKREMGWR